MADQVVAVLNGLLATDEAATRSGELAVTLIERIPSSLWASQAENAAMSRLSSRIGALLQSRSHGARATAARLITLMTRLGPQMATANCLSWLSLLLSFAKTAKDRPVGVTEAALEACVALFLVGDRVPSLRRDILATPFPRLLINVAQMIEGAPASTLIALRVVRALLPAYGPSFKTVTDKVDGAVRSLIAGGNAEAVALLPHLSLMAGAKHTAGAWTETYTQTLGSVSQLYARLTASCLSETGTREPALSDASLQQIMPNRKAPPSLLLSRFQLAMSCLKEHLRVSVAVEVALPLPQTLDVLAQIFDTGLKPLMATSASRQEFHLVLAMLPLVLEESCSFLSSLLQCGGGRLVTVIGRLRRCTLFAVQAAGESGPSTRAAAFDCLRVFVETFGMSSLEDDGVGIADTLTAEVRTLEALLPASATGSLQQEAQLLASSRKKRKLEDGKGEQVKPVEPLATPHMAPIRAALSAYKVMMNASRQDAAWRLAAEKPLLILASSLLQPMDVPAALPDDVVCLLLETLTTAAAGPNARLAHPILAHVLQLVSEAQAHPSAAVHRCATACLAPLVSAIHPRLPAVHRYTDADYAEPAVKPDVPAALPHDSSAAVTAAPVQAPMPALPASAPAQAPATRPPAASNSLFAAATSAAFDGAAPLTASFAAPVVAQNQAAPAAAPAARPAAVSTPAPAKTEDAGDQDMPDIDADGPDSEDE